MMKPKISKRILRARERYHLRSQMTKEIASTVFHQDVENDPRPFACIEIFQTKIYGLLDSGATISALGSGSLDFLQKHNISFNKFSQNRSVKTADGKNQEIVGLIRCPIKYKNIVKEVTLYIVPSLKQSLYLGINFWKLFNLAPELFNKNVANSSKISISELEGAETQFHELSPQETVDLEKVVNQFPAYDSRGLGKTHLVTHSIDTQNATPVKQRHYPCSPAVEKLIYEEIERMEKLGVIEKCNNSPWNSPVVMVRKPGKNRLCLDYRKVNSVTKKDAYPIPMINGLLARLPKAKFISSIDLKDAYYQVPLDLDSKEMTAFTIPGKGHYQFNVMPFGLCNAAQTMCKLMDNVIPAELRKEVFVYLDDLLVVSEDFETHLKVLKQVATHLSTSGLTINVKKSKFCFKELKYLGYIVGHGEIKTDCSKVEAIKSFPLPKSPKQMRRFLGMCGWYRRFIPEFASHASALTDTLKKSKSFALTEEAILSFETLKEAMLSAPVLISPDYSKPFTIHCDASNVGIGSVLTQTDDEGHDRPIYYFSRKLNKHQRNYTVTELECLAVVESIKKFRPYIELQTFKVITDHHSLKWLMSQKELDGRLARWSLKLQAYNFEIEHRKGVQNALPDALSRDFIDSLDVPEVQVDLDSPHFKSEEYLNLIKTLTEKKEHLPDINVSEGFVYKRTVPYNGNPLDEDNAWKLWIPRPLTSSLVEVAHTSSPALHGGSHKTLHRLRQYYYWPNMTVDVNNFVSQCELCKCIKPMNKTNIPEMGKTFTVQRPFQHLYIDFLGPYPRSSLGNTSIFVVLDQLTKFPFIKPIRNATSKTAITILKDLYSTFSVPQEIFSDNGTQFTSHIFQDFHSSLGVKHLKTPIYTPQANASERVNRSILSGIKATIDGNQSSWDHAIPNIQTSLRSAVHSTIGVSPFYAMFGYNMITHGSTYPLLNKLAAIGESDLQILPHSSKMNLLHDRLMINIQMAHENSAKRYNLRSNNKTFSVGQVVFRRNFIQSDASKKISAKLCKSFLKAKVRKVVGNYGYELEDMDGKYLGVYHSKDIRS